jgi:hypothetical protein
MKSIFLSFLPLLFVLKCDAQNSIDLEKLTFKEDPRVLVKNHHKSADRLEPITALPAYTTYDMTGYRFGSIVFTEHCFISFLLNSVEDKKLVGLIMGSLTNATSKTIENYIFKRYGKPVVLQKEVQMRNSHNKPYPGGSAFLWRNVRDGMSLLLAKDYSLEDGKLVENATLVLINNTVEPSVKTNFKTALDRAIKTYQY